MPACLPACLFCLSARPAVQTKRRYKLKQLQETGKTPSHPDMTGAVVYKPNRDGGNDKEPLLPVTIHATSATGMQGQHRKGMLQSPGQVQSDQVSDKDTV